MSRESVEASKPAGGDKGEEERVTFRLICLSSLRGFEYRRGGGGQGSERGVCVSGPVFRR